MPFRELLDQQSVCIDDTSQSKTAVLLKVSQLLCIENPQLTVEQLFDAYWRRESLGSTAIGHGILIPHIRTALLSQTKACFLKLKHPVDFGAEDKQPIDLVFGLIVPEDQPNEHLKTLKEIIRSFSQSDFRIACRQTDNNDALYELLIDPHVIEMA